MHVRLDRREFSAPRPIAGEGARSSEQKDEEGLAQMIAPSGDRDRHDKVGDQIADEEADNQMDRERDVSHGVGGGGSGLRTGGRRPRVLRRPCLGGGFAQ